MVPLFFSGETLLVERCDDNELRPGDVAVMSGSAKAELIAHVVSAVHPLTTSSYLGVVDRERLRVLGRVVAVRRLGFELALPRTGVLFGHRLLSRPEMRAAGKLALTGAVQFSRPLRRLALGEAQVCRVPVEDQPRAMEFVAGAVGGGALGSLRSANGELVAAIARGRWVGVAWRANGAVVCAVPSWAKQLGLEAMLERALS